MKIQNCIMDLKLGRKCYYEKNIVCNDFYPGSRNFLRLYSGSGIETGIFNLLGGGVEFRDIAVDFGGCAYVTGYTGSPDFPTENPYQGNYGGSGDSFVTKLSSTGSSLIYSTYLGGSDSDYGCGIALDAALGAYVAGITYSNNFPTENPYQASFNEQSPG